MQPETNEDQALESLITITKILKKCHIQYRFLGSIISAALNGKVHRKINDLDLFIENGKKEIFIKELEKIGFKKKIKNHLRISEQLNLHIFQHPTLLETSFFGVDFRKDYDMELHTRYFHAKAPKSAVQDTSYELNGVNFVGIPASVVYKTILFSKSNPKRKKEIEIFETYNIHPYSGILYTFYFNNIDISLIPRSINFILEIIGIIRIKLGKNYDIWK